MRPASGLAKAKQVGGLRVTPEACLRHGASEGLLRRMPAVGCWYDTGGP